MGVFFSFFRCEELQLELATSSHRSRPTTTQSLITNHTSSWGGSKSGEIERIMAKIEQDNRILAELDHSRSTTLGGGGGLATSASSHALGECSPPISPITMSHTTPSIYPTSSILGGHNPSYQSQSHTLGYLSSTNTNYNPSSISTQFNSLGHTYKSNLMGHHTLGQLGTTLGPTTASVLGSGVTTTGLTHSGLSSLGTSIVPPSVNYTTNPTTFSSPLNITNNPTVLSQPHFTNPVTSSTLNQYTLPATYNPSVTTATFSNNVTFSNPLSSQLPSQPLTGPVGMSIKLKPLEEVELGKQLVDCYYYCCFDCILK